MSRDIRIRFVGYGAAFQHSAGVRKDDSSGAAERLQLFDNEIAVDVGGVCWETGGVDLRVIDHHFDRESGNFPCAAAGVLHLAERIKDWAGGGHGEPVWIVTHQDPDFDALCSVHLVRTILEGRLDGRTNLADLGVHPDGWLDDSRRRIDWFNPKLGGLPADDPRRTAILLAAVAARVDACQPFPYPRSKTLHAALYAAMQRDRAFRTVEDLAAFFEPVEEAMRRTGRNPLVDCLLEHIPELAAELELLGRVEDAYERDLRRARRAVVSVPVTDDYSAFHAKVAAIPFASSVSPLEPDPAHTDMTAHGQPFSTVDGIYLRDPECLLFKEYARADRENSPGGQGFLFTAVVYSNAKTRALHGDDHFFALDPERARGRHLYPLWAALQAAEVLARAEPGGPPAAALPPQHPAEPDADYETRADLPVRRWFRRRARGLAAHFADPWWDGDAFAGTIVRTPNAGAWIGRPGQRPDLSDDPVARIAAAVLEDRFFAAPGTLEDRSIDAEVGDDSPFAHDFRAPRPAPPAADGRFRFGLVELSGDAPLLRAGVAAQIGRALWPALEPEDTPDVPSDFEARHLIADHDSVAVWNRRGALIAYKLSAAARAEKLRAMFHEMSALARELSGETAGLDQLRGLQHRAAKLRWQLALPEARPLVRFYDAVGLHELVGGLRERAETEATGGSLKEIVKVQHSIEAVEVFVLTIYLTEMGHIALHGWIQHHPATGLLLLGGYSILALAFVWAVLRPGPRAGLREFFLATDGSRWPRVVLLALLFAVFALGIWNEWPAGERDETPPPPPLRRQRPTPRIPTDAAVGPKRRGFRLPVLSRARCLLAGCHEHWAGLDSQSSTAPLRRGPGPIRRKSGQIRLATFQSHRCGEGTRAHIPARLRYPVRCPRVSTAPLRRGGPGLFRGRQASGESAHVSTAPLRRGGRACGRALDLKRRASPFAFQPHRCGEGARAVAVRPSTAKHCCLVRFQPHRCERGPGPAARALEANVEEVLFQPHRCGEGPGPRRFVAWRLIFGHGSFNRTAAERGPGRVESTRVPFRIVESAIGFNRTAAERGPGRVESTRVPFES